MAALLHVVVRADADRRHVFLRADDVLERGDEFGGKPSVGHEDHSDHTSSPVLIVGHQRMS